MSDSNLKKVIHSRLVKQLKRPIPSINTCYSELDSLLKIGGWPLNNIIDIGLAKPGIGELRLLLPALRHLVKNSLAGANIILINPPHIPYAPALVKAQIKTRSITVIKAKTKADILWATEQTLSAKCCSGVITWLNDGSLSSTQARRLQLLADDSAGLNVLIRPERFLQHSAPFKLRIALTANADSTLKVNIIKQPQSWGDQQCNLSLAPHYEHLQRWHNRSANKSKLTSATPHSAKVYIFAKAQTSNANRNTIAAINKPSIAQLAGVS